MDPSHKLREHADAAVADIEDGASIMIGGFGLCGNPEALIDAVTRKGVGDITVMSNNCGNLGKGLARWLRSGQVRRFVGTYIGNNTDLHEQMAAGTVEVQLMPQGTFVERMRAAGAGLGGFFTPTGVGTVVAEGKELRELDGRTYVLERPLRADFAFIRARRGDAFGNLRFWRTARNFSPIMATAAQTTIAEVDELVAIGGLDPDDVHVSGIFVQRVLEVTDHEDPFEYRTVRERV